MALYWGLHEDTRCLVRALIRVGRVDQGWAPPCRQKSKSYRKLEEAHTQHKLRRMRHEN